MSIVRSLRMKRHICEKVLICIGRGLCGVYFKEINLFENFIFWKRCCFLCHPAELFPSFSQLGEENEHIQKVSLCGNRIVWLLHKHNFPHEQSSISDFMDNNSIIFMRCSLHFPSQLFILKNLQARWKLVRNTFFEEQLVGCSSDMLWQYENLQYF